LEEVDEAGEAADGGAVILRLIARPRPEGGR